MSVSGLYKVFMNPSEYIKKLLFVEIGLNQNSIE
jgi:hypothetical protein